MYFINKLDTKLGNYLHINDMKTKGILGGRIKLSKGERMEPPRRGDRFGEYA